MEIWGILGLIFLAFFASFFNVSKFWLKWTLKFIVLICFIGIFKLYMHLLNSANPEILAAFIAPFLLLILFFLLARE